MSVSPSALERSPLRIAEPKPTHYRPRSSPIRSSRRATELNRIPRPRNAFIIFRCQSISRLHSRSHVGLDRPPTPEKTLSKRAGAAWRDLPPKEKQVYKNLAEKERKEHQRKYPGYRYQPNRSKATKARASGPPTRREQVESLVLRTASLSRTSSESSGSACPSPASERASSPDPLPMPVLMDDPVPSLSHRRSMSLPQLQGINMHDPYPFSRTYFIEPTSCLSSPGPGPTRTPRRSSSARERSYSPVSATPPPDCAFDLQYPHTTIPFSSLASHSSTLSLPELITLSEGLALDDANSSGYSTPQTASSVHEHGPEYLSAPQAASSSTLFHRRQRSNTAPSAVISPLAAVSTLLGAWNGPITATAAATAGLPGFAVTPAENLFAMSPSSVPEASSLADGTVAYGQFFGQGSQESFSSSSSLCVPDMGVDMDRTPRRSDFPASIQEQYTQDDHVSAHGFSSLQPTYELQSYAAGLEDLNISASSMYGPTCGTNTMSSYEDIDFSEYLTMNSF
ncbi:hypothetical protein BDY19DRAFT_989355 [Irpex rosettiformis]|uniref:Uncharacterized protein n=1 Tax=Irpex rosettiformis TaxID=378272 RepID=A0ACB8UID6_9APHY|nr:hypothetical protein BDY19DRAFT_989355 [Irpex rosettiformis]